MKQILFNTEMVKAILEGRKTETRRPIKPQPVTIVSDDKSRLPVAFWADNSKWVKPPYQPGDILYVRETWLKADDGIYYRADETSTSRELREAYGYKWHPSIHMPKEAARLFLRVTEVRVERVQDIARAGAKAEGFVDYDAYTELFYFANTWENIYKNWQENPWVWVIKFERVEVSND